MINNIRFILNLITFGLNIFSCLISLIILIIVIHHFYSNRLKKEDKIVITFCMTIYLNALFATAINIFFNIQAILGDLYQQNFHSSWCISMGYLYAIFFAAIYWSFVNQAFYRLCRILYSTYRSLQYFWLYIILPPFELILISIFMCPLLVWHDLVYLPQDYHCYVSFTNLRGSLWVTLNQSIIPLSLLSLIYFRITIFLRRQSNNRTFLVRQRQQRDLIVIRRIFLTMSLIYAFGTPAIVILTMLLITGEEYSFLERIMWFFLSLSIIELSFALLFLTPQLKNIVLRKFRRDRVIPFDGVVAGAIQMKHNTTTE